MCSSSPRNVSSPRAPRGRCGSGASSSSESRVGGNVHKCRPPRGSPFIPPAGARRRAHRAGLCAPRTRRQAYRARPGAPRAHAGPQPRAYPRAARPAANTPARTQRAPVADAPARLQLARSAATTAAACPAQFGLEYLARRRHAQPPRQWLRSAVRNGIFGLRHARGRHGRESRSGAHARAAPAARERYDPNWIARPPRRDGMTVMAVDMNLDLIV